MRMDAGFVYTLTRGGRGPAAMTAMRRRTWILLTGALVTVVGILAVGEGLARASVSAPLAESASDGIVIAPEGIVLWGLATGTMPVTLTIDEETIATAITSSAPETQDTEILGIRIDEYIFIELLRTTPLGEIPVEVALRPVIIDEALTTEILSVTAGGLEFPPSVLVGADLPSGSELLDAGCVALRDARVEGNTLVLVADASRSCDSSA